MNRRGALGAMVAALLAPLIAKWSALFPAQTGYFDFERWQREFDAWADSLHVDYRWEQWRWKSADIAKPMTEWVAMTPEEIEAAITAGRRASLGVMGYPNVLRGG